jgi:hypothetical protein
VRLPTQSYLRLAEDPVTHRTQHVAVYADKNGPILSVPAKLSGGVYPSIDDVRKLIKGAQRKRITIDRAKKEFKSCKYHSGYVGEFGCSQGFRRWLALSMDRLLQEWMTDTPTLDDLRGAVRIRGVVHTAQSAEDILHFVRRFNLPVIEGINTVDFWR